MSLFSDPKCSIPLLPDNSTNECILIDKPAYATTGKGLGVFSFACSTDEIKFNGCTNVTGQWLNRRRVPNSGTQLKYSFKGLVLIISMILAFMGTVNAVTFKYDVQADNTKMPFCLHNINADFWDYSTQDFVKTLESLCGEKGSECVGRSGQLKAWVEQSGDKGRIEYADFYGWGRRDRLIGAIASTIALIILTGVQL